MKSLLVKPSVLRVCISLGISIFFGLSLFWFLQTTKHTKKLGVQLQQLDNLELQLKRTNKDIEKFEKLVAKRPDISAIPGEIKWENVELSWEDIAFSDLLHRLSGVYAQDRVFTLESFSYEQPSGGEPNSNVNLSDDPHLSGNQSKHFRLKGYFLCLWQ